MEDLTVAMVQGNKSNPHSAYEYAIACKRPADKGRPNSEIARRLGLSGEWGKSLLLLMAAPKELRARVANDALTVTLAVKLLKEHGSEEAAEMIEEAASEKEAQGKPVKLTRKNRRRPKASRSSSPARTLSPTTRSRRRSNVRRRRCMTRLRTSRRTRLSRN